MAPGETVVSETDILASEAEDDGVEIAIDVESSAKVKTCVFPDCSSSPLAANVSVASGLHATSFQYTAQITHFSFLARGVLWVKLSDWTKYPVRSSSRPFGVTCLLLVFS